MSKHYPHWLVAALLLPGCHSSSTETKTEETTSVEGTEKAALPGLPRVQPVPLPDPGIPGFAFPEDSATIDKWVQQRAVRSINLHGWGIWTALTAATSETYGPDKLRVFETWHSKAEVDSIMKAQAANKLKMDVQAVATTKRPFARHLERPVQFFHARDPHHRLQLAHAMLQASPADTASGIQPVFEDVSYNPTAAQTIITRQLFMPGVLDAMLAAKRTAIPDFPKEAIAIKPVYEVIPGPNNKLGGGQLYKMKVWSQMPPSQIKKPRAFGQDKWSSWVYVDPTNQGKGHGQVYQTGGASPRTKAEGTYNLTDFVYHTLTAYEAGLLNPKHSAQGAQPGDYAILVAMHITSREIQRWTWQTVWWAPDPDHAPAPSNPAVVAARPSQLAGAPRHYAMSIAYQMLDPVQPFTGGTNKGQPVYAFNPYLEAGFNNRFGGPTVVPPGLVRTPVGLVSDSVGTQTNCMTCHAQANYAAATDNSAPGYQADTYIDMKGPQFKGRLKVDFLWSVADMAEGNRSQLQAMGKK
jgi:hypothetical protein